MSQAAAATDLGPELPGMRCVRLIGSGGFADVYQYERERPKQQVAVKLLKNLGTQESRLRQFDAEADVMAALEHPYIVPVLWTDIAPDGRPYIVMRYYPSQDLAARVSNTPMTVDEALRLGIQLAGAVETAHRAKIIHRDIKPSNILVSPEGWPALTDFGIAGRPNAEGESEDVAVSVAWSPPEVLTGQSDGSVVADVYSLAATVWNLLTGRAPFEIPGASNEARDMFSRIVHSKPPSTGREDVPASLDRILQQALAKDPGRRPQSALELARHLQRVEQEQRLTLTEIIVRDPPAESQLLLGEAAGASRDRTELRDGLRTELRSPAPVVDAAQTVHKQAIVVDSSGPSPAAPPTELRPRRVEHAQAPPPHLETQRRGKRQLLLLAGAGGVVMAAALVTALSLSRGDEKTPVIPDASRTTNGNDNGNVLPPAAGAAADPQPVTWRIRGQSVVFVWAAVPGAAWYEWAVEPGGTAHQGSATRAVVPKVANGPTCIRVHAVTPGAPETPGTRKCAT